MIIRNQKELQNAISAGKKIWRVGQSTVSRLEMSQTLHNETNLAKKVLSQQSTKLDDFLLFDDKQEARNIRNALQTIFQTIRFKNI
jgi:Ribonuclease G/E